MFWSANWVRIWETDRDTPTENSEDYPLPVPGCITPISYISYILSVTFSTLEIKNLARPNTMMHLPYGYEYVALELRSLRMLWRLSVNSKRPLALKAKQKLTRRLNSGSQPFTSKKGSTNKVKNTLKQEIYIPFFISFHAYYGNLPV